MADCILEGIWAGMLIILSSQMIPIPLSTALSSNIINLCLMLGTSALAGAIQGYQHLRNIQNQNNLEKTAVKEYILLSLVRAGSWFIIAAGTLSFSPIVIGMGLVIVAGSHLYNNSASYFFRKKQEAIANEGALNNLQDNTLTYWRHLGRNSKLPL